MLITPNLFHVHEQLLIRPRKSQTLFRNRPWSALLEQGTDPCNCARSNCWMWRDAALPQAARTDESCGIMTKICLVQDLVSQQSPPDVPSSSLEPHFVLLHEEHSSPFLLFKGHLMCIVHRWRVWIYSFSERNNDAFESSRQLTPVCFLISRMATLPDSGWAELLSSVWSLTEGCISRCRRRAQWNSKEQFIITERREGHPRQRLASEALTTDPGKPARFFLMRS